MFIGTIKFASCPTENTLILRYLDELVISIDKNKYHLSKESYEVHKVHKHLAKFTVLNVDAESKFATAVVLCIDHPTSWSQLFVTLQLLKNSPSVCVTRIFITVRRCHHMSLT